MSLCLRLHSEMKIGLTFIKTQNTSLQANGTSTDFRNRSDSE